MELVQPITYLLQGAAFGLTAAASPGAFQSYLISQTLSGGWKRGVPVALAPLISDPPIVIAIVVLLDQLPTRLIDIIGIGGGVFALYLAWGLWKGWRQDGRTISLEDAGRGEVLSTNEEQATPQKSNQTFWGILGRGALINLLSPGPYTFWALVLGPILLGALEESSVDGIAFLVGFYTTFIGGMLLLVALFHQARRLGAGVVRALTLTSILILAVFGLILILGNLR
jgi:threonine/homoserine/homoserine lactone efflux protein